MVGSGAARSLAAASAVAAAGSRSGGTRGRGRRTGPPAAWRAALASAAAAAPTASAYPAGLAAVVPTPDRSRSAASSSCAARCSPSSRPDARAAAAPKPRESGKSEVNPVSDDGSALECTSASRRRTPGTSSDRVACDLRERGLKVQIKLEFWSMDATYCSERKWLCPSNEPPSAFQRIRLSSLPFPRGQNPS